MLNAAHVLPAGPGELDDDVFPLRLRLRLRDNFGFAVQQLRTRGTAFRDLAKGPWSVFIAIATHFQMNVEAWPGQEAIAHLSACSTRAVRYHVAILESRGVFVLRRERRHDGSERIFYQPGPAMLRELAAFDELYPKDRAKRLRRVASPASAPPPPSSPAESLAGAPAEKVATEPRDQDLIEPSSSCKAQRPAKPPTPVTEEEKLEVTPEDREVAHLALGERMARKHPTRPPPRWFDAGELAMVAACAAAIGGDVEAKMTAHRDAIVGAFLASKDGPPTVRFIWEKLDHFFDHVDRGRRSRLAAERTTRHRAIADVAPTSWVARVPTPGVNREQMHADLERLFGPGWRSAHVSR
jgi:hypothetical protein